MDSTIERIQHLTAAATQQRVTATSLNTILETLSPDIKVISLDCFDTLLWRKVYLPRDAFYLMQDQPAFRQHGLSARMRLQVEDKARSLKAYQTGNNEVNLSEIYLTYDETLSDAQIADLTAAELMVEKQLCFAYAPMVELIHRAKKRGLQIILVSDTYFSSSQLRELLEACLPSETAKMIDEIFCSNEFGQGKSAGLFNHVLKKLGKNASSLLHLGDNVIADLVAPQLTGINACHFQQYDVKADEIFRMHALAAGLLDHDIRSTRPMYHPYKTLFSNPTVDCSKPEALIGYLAIGPIMYAFTHYILHKIKEIEAQGKQCKVVFLMRDGYLSSLCCEAYQHKTIGSLLYISRFTSYAASFRSVRDIDDYLSGMVKSLRFKDICKQLLLSENKTKSICAKVEHHKDAAREFTKLIREEKTVNEIIEASRQFRQRLIKHIQHSTGIKPGEVLLFVDLGYTGTSQIKLTPVLRDEMKIEVVGCYLLALEVQKFAMERTGLFDRTWCDERTLQAVVNYIALFEQISTVNENSVIDYREDGSPVLSTNALQTSQQNQLDKIQYSVIQFIHDARDYFVSAKYHPSHIELRDYALAELARFLYFPTDIELNYLKTFQFEVNMGVNDVLNVLDHEKGLIGLRKRGMFFMERNLKSMRTNYPAELRYVNIELAMMLMQSHRVEFEMGVNDFSLRRDQVNIIAIHGNQTSQLSIQAMPTHDGYFSLIIPVGHGDYQIGVHFGNRYKVMQIESAELIPSNHLYGFKESTNTMDAGPMIVLDKMTDHGDGLFTCDAESGLLIFSPQQLHLEQNHVLRIVYRPISRHQKANDLRAEAIG